MATQPPTQSQHPSATFRAPGGVSVLRTRALPPRLPSSCVARPALVARLHAAFEGRLTALIAGAGYGKSTLLAQAVASLKTSWAWLSCDERLRSSEELLAQLAVAIEGAFPGLAARLVFEGTVPQQIALLSNELVEVLPEDLVVVLDDVHALPEGPAREAVGLLVRDLPPAVHVAVASRTALPFPLGRLRTDALVLGEADLALSPEETAEVVRARRPALADRAGELHERTEGWVAGVVLALQPGAPSESLLGRMHFDYLVEEVLGRLPEEIQQFLLETSVLERFTPALAAAVTGRLDAHETIGRLVADHLFTIPLEAEGEWYRYHHLMSALLRRRLAGSPERRAELHRRAADAWLSAGERTEAVPHLLEAGEHARAVDVIEPLAEGMIGTPAASALADWLALIPREQWKDRPALILADAFLHRSKGPVGSIRCRGARAG